MSSTRHSITHLARSAAAIGFLAITFGAASAEASAVDRFAVGGPAMEAARGVATARWGGDACDGQVTIDWTALDASVSATAVWTNPIARYGEGLRNTACRIHLNSQVNFSWEGLCTTLVHEYGHLTGHDHSADPANVMAPTYSAPLAQCSALPDPGLPAAIPVSRRVQPLANRPRSARAQASRNRRAAQARSASHHIKQ